MKNESIPSKIIDILTEQSRLTINEIFEKSELPIEKKGYLRLCVNRLSGAKNPKIAKDGKNGKEYLYSLIERTTNSLELLKQLHTVMVNRMDFTETLNEKEIKNIENIEELIKNEPIR